MMAWAVCSTAAAGACAARSMVSEASYTDCDRRRPTVGARAKEPRNAGSSGLPAIAVVASYTERGSLHLGSYTDCIILVGPNNSGGSVDDVATVVSFVASDRPRHCGCL